MWLLGCRDICVIERMSVKGVANDGGGASPNRDSIGLGDPHEVRAWTTNLGCTEIELRAVVQAIGNDADKVRAFLRGNS